MLFKIVQLLFSFLYNSMLHFAATLCDSIKLSDILGIFFLLLLLNDSNTPSMFREHCICAACPSL